MRITVEIIEITKHKATSRRFMAMKILVENVMKIMLQQYQYIVYNSKTMYINVLWVVG